MTRTLTLVFVAVCLSLSPPRAAAASSPHIRCADTVDPEYTPDQSFEAPIHDPRTLAFISLLENQGVADQRRALKRTDALDLDDNSLSTMAEVTERNCADTDVHLREMRLKYALEARWGQLAESLYFQFAAAAISLTVSERSAKPGFVGKRIPVAVLDRSLAVFGTSTAKLDRMVATRAAPLSPNACNGSAIVTKSIAPNESLYDPGDPHTVDVDVSLDEHGYVRSAKAHDADVVNRSADVVSASVVAAAVSTYSPAFANCKPVASTFLFHAVFTGRR